MKANTIIAIDEILKQKVSLAKDNFGNYKWEMDTKYQQETWRMSPAETKACSELENEYKEINEIYADFQNHQW
jgi:hypothetical protein